MLNLVFWTNIPTTKFKRTKIEPESFLCISMIYKLQFRAGEMK